MTSTYTPLGFNRQGPGDNSNTWGDVLNSEVFDLVDEALRGLVSFALSGSKTLTTGNGVSNEARRAIIWITGGTGGTVTVPTLSKAFAVVNQATGDVTITAGGTGAVVKAGESLQVICDGASVRRVQATDMAGAKLAGVGAPTNSNDAATKGYVDALAFAAVDLPGQVGNAGKYLKTDGTNATWQNQDSVSVASAADVRAGADTTRAVTSGALADAVAFAALTDATTVAWDTAVIGPQAKVMIAGNRTIGAPTNLKDGLTYVLDIYQDATGGRTVSWNGIWDFGISGSPTAPTGAGKKMKVVAQYCADRTKLEVVGVWKQA